MYNASSKTVLLIVAVPPNMIMYLNLTLGSQLSIEFSYFVVFCWSLYEEKIMNRYSILQYIRIGTARNVIEAMMIALTSTYFQNIRRKYVYVILNLQFRMENTKLLLQIKLLFVKQLPKKQFYLCQKF